MKDKEISRFNSRFLPEVIFELFFISLCFSANLRYNYHLDTVKIHF